MPKFLLQSPEALKKKFSNIDSLEKKRLFDAYKNKDSSTWSFRWGLENKPRNRYSDVLPFDKNRVKLKTISDDYPDYINASNIELSIGSTAGNYISTQGPIGRTAEQFWHMCNQRCKDQIIIVMVTPLIEKNQEKCFKYWSDTSFIVDNKNGLRQQDGDTLVFNFKNQTKTDVYQLTEWEMTNESKTVSKQVLHFYYDQWEDFSTPTSADHIIELSESVHKYKKKLSNDPIIVHCSAGVGRSGTFITIDHFLNNCLNYFDQDNATGKSTSHGDNSRNGSGRTDLITPIDNPDLVDPIYAIVLDLRTQRVMMVQKFEQFVFIYNVIKKFYIDNYLNK